jgi:pimeloyl-ACP methyl ester carboxylesterase
MGLSGTPEDGAYDYTLASRVDDLDTLLEARGIDADVTLVVHDWGGSIGLGYALRHPGRVTRLVILNTAAFHLPAGMEFPRNLALVRTPKLGPFLVRGLNAFSREAVRRCVTTPLSAGVRRAYLEPYNTWHNRLAVLRFVRDIPIDPADRAYDMLTEIEASLPRYCELPVMICWGMRDFLFGPEFLEEWIRRLPEAEVHRYDAAGHYVMEDAGDEIARRVRAFLDRHASDARQDPVTSPQDA